VPRHYAKAIRASASLGLVTEQLSIAAVFYPGAKLGVPIQRGCTDMAEVTADAGSDRADCHSSSRDDTSHFASTSARRSERQQSAPADRDKPAKTPAETDETSPDRTSDDDASRSSGLPGVIRNHPIAAIVCFALLVLAVVAGIEPAKVQLAAIAIIATVPARVGFLAISADADGL
jgi:hypothetical protein